MRLTVVCSFNFHCRYWKVKFTFGPSSGVACELQGGLRTRGWLAKNIFKRQSKTEAEKFVFKNLCCPYSKAGAFNLYKVDFV